MTRAPAADKAFAIASPIPEAAPVMSAVLGIQLEHGES